MTYLKNIYFVGIKGVGMTALAIYCKQKGINVAGSDTKESYHTDSILKKENIPVFLKNIEMVKNADLVIYSGAYDVNKNEELISARDNNIKIVSHGEALGIFMEGSKQISIAGTHGKTTTTALIAAILTQANLDPSYVIGASSVDPLGAPGHFGQGKYFVAEADEYQTSINNNSKPRFLWQKPFILVITNIDFDHPDVYKNIEEVKNAFRQLVSKVPKEGLIVYNLKDKNSVEVVSNAVSKKIGFDASYQNLKTNLIGKHNKLNISAALAVSDFLGINKSHVVNTLIKFSGAKRRLELICEKEGILYIDDYAHHPTEIKASLSALKEEYPKRRIIVAFQPHTYSRTQVLLSEFSESFANADIVILDQIFASAREKKENFQVSVKQLFEAIKGNKKDVFLADSTEGVIQYIKDFRKEGDIVVSMGAGNIYKIHDSL